MSKQKIGTNGIGAGQAAPENLDKVRELLFGPQLGQVETRVGRVEQQLGSQLKASTELVQARLDSVERFVHDEFESVAARLSNEKELRDEQNEELKSLMLQSVNGLEKKLTALDNRLTEMDRRLRQQTRSDILALQQQTQNQLDTLGAEVRKAESDLVNDKVGRGALAGFLRDVALQLDQGLPAELNDILAASTQEGTKRPSA